MEEKLENFRFKNSEEFKHYLDEAPQESWLQIRELGAGKKHIFLPLFITEANADLLFKNWYVADEKFIGMNGGVLCTVKIQALPDYPEADYISFTGTAGVLFKSSKNAIEFDAPNSRERAIGKAFQTLGNIFGRSLNRSYKSPEGKILKIKRGFSFLEKESNNE
tara:strand:+ start:1214 stop:1705 length:492 start_codon:yes stop_codon:yes gene_type:complete